METSSSTMRIRTANSLPARRPRLVTARLRDNPAAAGPRAPGAPRARVRGSPPPGPGPPPGCAAQGSPLSGGSRVPGDALTGPGSRLTAHGSRLRLVCRGMVDELGADIAAVLAPRLGPEVTVSE